MAEERTATASSAQISDGTWTFSISKDGTIAIVAGPSKVGAKYLPGSESYNLVVWNLGKTSGNRQRMLKVCPGLHFVEPAQPPQIKVAQQDSNSTALAIVEPPPPDQGGAIWQRKWFWPAVIGLGASAVIGSVILFWPKKEAA
jgi:hypothetical protein